MESWSSRSAMLVGVAGDWRTLALGKVGMWVAPSGWGFKPSSCVQTGGRRQGVGRPALGTGRVHTLPQDTARTFSICHEFQAVKPPGRTTTPRRRHSLVEPPQCRCDRFPLGMLHRHVCNNRAPRRSCAGKVLQCMAWFIPCLRLPPVWCGAISGRCSASLPAPGWVGIPPRSAPPKCCFSATLRFKIMAYM